jgi:hypothetical protein
LGRRLFPPDTAMRSHTFHHQQVYRFQVHRAKLELLTQPTTHPATGAHKEFVPLTNYLASVETHFPHNLFQATEHRSSKFPAEIHPPVTRKENHATRLAALVLPTALNNKKRHGTLQRCRRVTEYTQLIPVIPFSAEAQRITETVETGAEVKNVLATRINSGYYRQV